MKRLIAPALAVLLLGSACKALPGAVPPKPPDAAAGTHPGGTLTVGITQPSSIEPIYATDPVGKLVASTICETLVTIDPVTGEVKPGLAEKFVVSTDGNAITIKLRKNTRFHDGTEMKSIDAVYALQTLANPESASSMAELLRPVQQYEDFRKKVEEGAALGGALIWQGVRVIEPYSFEITLGAKEPDFLRVLANPATAPYSKAAAQRNPQAFSEQPVCAGPYKMAAPYKPGDPDIRLTRFKDYADKNATLTGGGNGYADEILFRVFPDQDAQYREFEAGNLDVATVPPSKLTEARAKYGDKVISGPSPQVEFVGLPRGPESPFTKTSVRIALSQAINRNEIVGKVFGGSRKAAGGFLPASLGPTTYRDKACGENAPLEGNVEAARASLARSKVDFSGQTFKFYFNDEYVHRGLVESVAAQWKNAFGLNIELQPMNWDQYLQKATTGAGFDGPFRVSWTGTYPSAQAYLAPLFLSANIGSSNLQRYSDQLYDEAFERDAKPVVDENERILQFQSLEDRLCKQIPIIPIAFAESHIVMRGDRVAAARPQVLALDGRLLLMEVYVR